MKAKRSMEFLHLLDSERQTVVYPGVTRFSDRGTTKDIPDDGKSCEIVYSSCSESEIDSLIEHEIQLAQHEQYELEWKIYGHDQPPCLAERLSAAGFEAGDKEAFMVFTATPQSLACFGTIHSDIRRVTNREGLKDYQIIRKEVSGRNCETEMERYAFLLENYPDNMSVYVAYVDGEPTACGRIYFHERSQLAYLYGGQTRERFRKRGLFTQMVAVRLREAWDRGIQYICVDALPTSEPILQKRGFEYVTHTQSFSVLSNKDQND